MHKHGNKTECPTNTFNEYTIKILIDKRIPCHCLIKSTLYFVLLKRMVHLKSCVLDSMKYSVMNYFNKTECVDL